ncbi:tetratricopeptide repeat protein [Sulfurihydrogenibium sp.]|uniref:tetratricopeptide repeat protein n=1 Tax=Sulfurihydrogenibium sp. TaxID=2053621 RepID=UPI003D0C8FE1
MKNIYFSIISEILAISSLFVGNIFLAAFLYLIFHGLAIFLLSTFLLLLLPKRYRKKESFYFMLIFGFFSSVAGFIFLLISTKYLFRKQKNIEYKPIETFSIEEIYNEDIEFSGRKFGEGGLVGIIKSENAPKVLKEKAFLTLTDLRSPSVFNLIKENLSNPVDEIRLLAFSIISKFEKDLTEKIHELEKKLKEEISQEEKAEIYKDLAQIYWDFVLYNLVDEEFKEFMLKTAEDYAFKSLQIKENPYVYFLLGRMYLRKKKIEESLNYLLKAYNDKALRQKVIPYLAECYFYKKDFSQVKNLMKEIDLTIDLRIKFIRDFWLTDGRVN